MRKLCSIGMWLFLGIGLGWATPALAQQKDIGVQPVAAAGWQAGYTDSWALVIGINQYRHPGIERLKAAVSDARAMETVLPALGFSRIIRLLDQEATKARIEQELYGTLKQMKPNDRLLIFFSGHGKRVELPKGGEEAWLMPVDADPTTPERTGIPLHEFDRIGRFHRAVKNNRQPGREAVRLIETLREARCSVADACRLVGLSRSRYYAARQERSGTVIAQDPSDQALLVRIRPISEAHPFWGYRRV